MCYRCNYPLTSTNNRPQQVMEESRRPSWDRFPLVLWCGTAQHYPDTRANRAQQSLRNIWTDGCVSLCVYKLIQRYKCLNLGSILTTCYCRTWEMTAYHYLTLLWSIFESRMATPACVWGCVQGVNCEKVTSQILICLIYLKCYQKRS